MQGHHHTPLQALRPPVSAEHPTHSLCQTEGQSGEVTSRDDWGVAAHTSQCWLGGPCGTDSSRTRPPHWPTRRGCCSQDHLLLCHQHCKHCSVCRREGQTGKLWTSAPLATVGETTTTTVGTSMEVGQSRQISSNNPKPHICSQF